MSLNNRYQSVIDRINLALNNSEIAVDLLAVSKKQPIQMIHQLYELGQRKFGESYIKEAIEKIEQSQGFDIEWHFIGPIQSNKTKYIAQHFSWVQSVDSLKLLTRLNKQRVGSKQKLNVLLQLKVGGEDSKRGLSPQELLTLTKRYLEFDLLTIRGLMSIPAPTTDINEQQDQFEICHAVFQQMQNILPVDTLSMGMSGDLEAAIAAGTTMVRIGTDIFGAREL